MMQLRRFSALLILVALASSSTDAIQNAAQSLPGYPDTRRVDTKAEFANVGALIVTAEKNDAGIPEGKVAFCSGTLIDDRVVLTAGHCVCQGLPEPPAFIRLFVSFAADARDESTWLPVAKIAGHPSLPVCKPPLGLDAYGPAPLPNLHDVGLVFLADSVRGIAPARLATTGSLDRPEVMQKPMMIVGYGLPRSIPGEQRWKQWDGLRRVRTKRLVQVIDDSWATWALPGEVCNGDSGGPIFVTGSQGEGVAATVSFSGECRASVHARVDTKAVQTWIAETIKANTGAK